MRGERQTSMNIYKAQEIIDGCLLSDASLPISTTEGGACFDIALSGEEHIDWLNVVWESLTSLGVVCSAPTNTPRVNKKGDYIECRLRSYSSPLLTALRHEWYPNGIKIVPKRTHITDLTLANWFMGDGSSSWYMPSVWRHCYAEAALCTQGFSEEDLDILVRELKRVGISKINRGLVSKTNREKSNKEPKRVLRITRWRDVKYFMECVRPFIVPSYSYKIKIPTGGS